MSLVDQYDRLCEEKEDLEREMARLELNYPHDEGIYRIRGQLEDLEEEIESIEGALDDMEVEE